PTSAFPDQCTAARVLTLLQHVLVDAAEPPDLSILAVAVLHGDLITLLQRGEFGLREDECDVVRRSIVRVTAHVEFLIADPQHEDFARGQKWTVAVDPDFDSRLIPQGGRRRDG